MENMIRIILMGTGIIAWIFLISALVIYLLIKWEERNDREW